MNPSTSRIATGSLNPDSASSVSREPSPQRRATQQGEDRGAVGRGQDRAQQQPLQRWRSPSSHAATSPVTTRGHDRPQHRQRDRGPQHRADLEIAGGQAALEQDQGQGDDPDRPRQLVVAEVDPAGAVRCRSPSRAPGRGPAPGVADGRRAARRRFRPRAAPRRRGSARHRSRPQPFIGRFCKAAARLQSPVMADPDLAFAGLARQAEAVRAGEVSPTGAGRALPGADRAARATAELLSDRAGRARPGRGRGGREAPPRGRRGAASMASRSRSRTPRTWPAS